MISQAENMINISGAAAEAIFQHVSEGILFTDTTGVIVRMNLAAEKIFGQSKEELTGKSIQDLVKSKHDKKEVPVKSELQEETRFSNERTQRFTGIRKDGSEFAAEVKYSLFTSGTDVFTIAFITDLTFKNKCEFVILQQRDELHQLKKEERELNVELETRVRNRTRLLEEALHEIENRREVLKHALEKEAELNEMKSRFISMASHEFRTPLATILSSTNLSAKYGQEGDYEKQAKHISRIKSAVTHMTELMNDVLSVSKLEEGIIAVSPEILDLPAFMNTLINDIKPLLKNGQVILFRHKGDNQVFLDKKILKNLMFNLFTNAIKFSHENKPICVKSEVNNGFIRISVQDQGIGIAEEDQKKLFKRFFRAENAANIQGTGLGLYITVKYAELLHGKITFQSRLNEGTEFSIMIPNKKTE